MAKTDTLPSASSLNDYHCDGDYLDTYSVSLSGRQDLQKVDIRVLADHLINNDIEWMTQLLNLRDKVVRPFGLKTTDDLVRDQEDVPVISRLAGDRISFFRIYEVSSNEIVLGEDDWHQDFRLSILRENGPEPRVFASTCCKRHNIFGHAYLALILPIHKKIAKTMLDDCIGRRLVAA